MIRRGVFILSLIGAALLLAWLSMGWVRDSFVNPLMSLVSLAASYYASLNQLAAWPFFVLFVMGFAAMSLFRALRIRRKVVPAERIYPSRVAEIANWLEMRPKGHYFKWLLAQHLSQLALGLVASSTAGAPDEGKEQLLAEETGIPPEIRAYLEAGLRPRSKDLTWKDMGQGRSRMQKTPLDLDPEAVVRFLEIHFEMINPEVESGIGDR